METQKEKNLLEASAAAEEKSARLPQGLPEKFWDAEKGEVKLTELIQAYNDLVARDSNLVETNLRNIPESYDKYQINSPSPLLDVDDDILKKFYEKQFTNEQAQLVYDLAGERVLPVLGEMGVNFEAERQLEKLGKHFGGREKFNEISRQISAWAKQNVNPEVYKYTVYTCRRNRGNLAARCSHTFNTRQIADGIDRAGGNQFGG